MKVKNISKYSFFYKTKSQNMKIIIYIISVKIYLRYYLDDENAKENQRKHLRLLTYSISHDAGNFHVCITCRGSMNKFVILHHFCVLFLCTLLLALRVVFKNIVFLFFDMFSDMYIMMLHIFRQLRN